MDSARERSIQSIVSAILEVSNAERFSFYDRVDSIYANLKEVSNIVDDFLKTPEPARTIEDRQAILTLIHAELPSAMKLTIK